MKGTTKTTPLPFNCFYPRRPLVFHEVGNEYGTNRFTTVSLTDISRVKRAKARKYVGIKEYITV